MYVMFDQRTVQANEHKIAPQVQKWRQAHKPVEYAQPENFGTIDSNQKLPWAPGNYLLI